MSEFGLKNQTLFSKKTEDSEEGQFACLNPVAFEGFFSLLLWLTYFLKSFLSVNTDWLIIAFKIDEKC